MSLYSVINWFFFITCALLIGFIFYSRRYYFVKPSILLITFSIIFFQFPLAIFSATYEVTVPDPYILSFLIHGYILIGLTVSLYTSRIQQRPSGIGSQRKAVSDFRANKCRRHSCGSDYLYHCHLSCLCSLQRNRPLCSICKPSRGGYCKRTISEITRQSCTRLCLFFYDIVYGTHAGDNAFFNGHTIFSEKTIRIIRYNRFRHNFSHDHSQFAGGASIGCQLLLAMCISFFLIKGLPFQPAKLLLLLVLIVTPGTLIGIYRDGGLRIQFISPVSLGFYR